MASRYSAFRDSVYDDLSAYLASLHGDFDAPEARERWHGAIDAVTRASLADAPAVRSILSAEQYARIPLALRQQLELTRNQVDRLLRGPQVGIAP